MANFELERKLPSCQVTRRLLELLEKYILEKKKTLGTEIEQLPSEEGLTLLVTDNLGTESLISTQQLRTDRFLDSTREVSVKFYARWHEKGTALLVRVCFSKNRDRSGVTIISESDTARELAVGIYQSVSEIIETSKTRNWFFHPPTGLPELFFAVSMMLPFLSYAVGDNFEIPHMFLRSIFLSIVGIMYIFMGPVIHPYTTFDSPSADRLRAISNWYKGAVSAFLLFSVIFPFISKILLGS